LLITEVFKFIFASDTIGHFNTSHAKLAGATKHVTACGELSVEKSDVHTQTTLPYYVTSTVETSHTHKYSMQMFSLIKHIYLAEPYTRQLLIDLNSPRDTCT